MGDGGLSIFGQILFIVRKYKGRFIIEKISPISKDESQTDFENIFSEQTKKELTSRCGLCLSGQDHSDSFSANLNGHPYIITLISRFECAFIFLAAEIPDNSVKHEPESAALLQSCSVSARGIFFWRVKNLDFFLSYANASYFLQTGLPGKSMRKTPEDIFSPKKASLIRSQLLKCLKQMRPVSYINKFSKRSFGITLYPQIKDNEVFRIMGISTDITKQVGNIIQTQQGDMRSSQYGNMLQEHIRYEEVLSRSAREFLDSGLSGFNECVEKMIASLGPLFDADWVFAGKSKSALCGISSHWMARPETGRDRLCGIAESTGFGQWTSQLHAGRIFVVNDIHKEMPSLYTALKCAGNPEVRSFIAVPVFRSDEYWGVLCVSSFRQKRIWITKEISVLKTAADIIMSAYLRTKMEKQLSESNRVLVEYDECLQDMLSVQESLNTISRKFLAAEPKGFSGCVNDMLNVLSELTDVDQACITVLNGTTPKCFSWHKKGMTYHAYEHDKFNLNFSAWSRFISDSEQISIEDVSLEMNSLPIFVQDYILSTGLKSLLIIPIRSGETIVAILFLVKVLGGCSWTNSIIHTAKQFGDIFRDAHLRIFKQEQQLLETKCDSNMVKEMIAHTELIKSFAECTQLLIDATAENLLSIYRTICKTVSQHLPIDSVNLTQYSQDYTKTFIVFNWHATGPLSASSQSDSYDNAVISIPVFYREIVWGCLLVNLTFESPSDGYMRGLEIMAESFVRAYMRIYPDKKDLIGNVKLTAVSLSPHPFAI